MSVMSLSTSLQSQAALESPESISRLVCKVPRIGYVFSGQGAQWFAMGRELIDTCPAFTAALHRAERCLQQLGAQWSLMGELTRIETESRLNEPALSMAVTTSLQLGLVELLRSWGIEPVAVTSHSSGEAAAAYAAGAIDFESAIAISYYAGFLAQDYQEKLNIRGAMIAVGLGPAEVLSYLDTLHSGRVIVACINSPSSVTLSGDVEAIAEVEERVRTGKIFVRRLKVSAAYHSHHMLSQSDDYLALLSAKFGLTPESFTNIRYSSPVSGKTVRSAASLGPQNWIDNITKPVLFAQSLSNMCYGQAQVGDLEPQQLVDTIVEIGPHDSLAGPVRQVLNQTHLKRFGISYANCLEQNKSAITTMQSLVYTLLRKGYPVDMTKVNILSGQTTTPSLQTLPSDHSMSSLKELPLDRACRVHQHVPHLPHDSLGPAASCGNDFAPVWRHLITSSQPPWIRDHVVQSELVYPIAAFMTMAIEAYEQIYPSSCGAKEVYHLENILLEATLVVPDTAKGVEVQLRLHKRDQRFLDSESWLEYVVDSVDPSGKWQHHCRGSITRQAEVYHTSSVNVQRVLKESRNVVNVGHFYDSFADIGIEYGPLFRNVSKLASGDSMATGEINVPNTSAAMPMQSGGAHVIHPSTLDAIFQAMYATLPNAGQELDVAMIPKKVESLVVRPYLQIRSRIGIRFAASRNRLTQRSFDASLVAFTDGDVPAIEVSNLHFRAKASSVRNTNGTQRPIICSTMHWREDLTLMHPDRVTATLQMPPDEAEQRLIADVKRVSFHLIYDALAALSLSDIGNLEWHHKAYYDWMLTQVQLAKADQIAPRSSKWLNTSVGVKEMLIEKVAGASVSGKLVVRIGKNLLPILRKETSPLQLMLEGRLLYAYYERALRVSRSYVQVRRLVELIGHKMPRANILEVGGGTAGCTVPVLQALRAAANNANPGFQNYVFTDVSPDLFEMAREKLSEWGSMITYRPLDIERSPETQGFVGGSYDIIVACQALHATKSMAKTMANVRSLLRPGGKLLMVETTQDALDVQLIFGTLPGWWSSEEAERKRSPSLSLNSWSHILQQNGFSGLDCSVNDSEDPKNYPQSVLLSTALDEAIPVPLAPLAVVFTGEQPPASWVQAISSEVESFSSSPWSLLPLSEAIHSAKDKVCILVDNRDQPLLSDIEKTNFDALRDVLSVAKGALWLHYGGTVTSPLPTAGLVQGLLRVLRYENSAKRFISLDMDSTAALFAPSSCRSIAAVLRASFDERQPQENIECEYAQRNVVLFIPRLYESVEESQATSGTNILDVNPEPRPLQDGERDLVMDIGTPGALETLHFAERSVPDYLDNDLVEIVPKAFGLNSRDIMVAMGQLDSDKMGFECSGIISKVGSAVTSVMPGDRVCALLQGELATTSRIHESSVMKIPDSMSFEVAASIPVVYATAYYSLFTVGRLEKDESVLIHAAAEGVGQAAIALAKFTGAKVYATAESSEKHDFLVKELGVPADQVFSSRDTSFTQQIMAATHGRGVDVILNSLPGRSLQASWCCIAKFGRFVQIGINDLESKHLDMKPFARAACFTAVDLLHLSGKKPLVVVKVMRSVFDLLTSGGIQPVNPVTVLPMSQIGRAFRIMSQDKHMGKIVIKAEHDDLVPVKPQRPVTKLRSDATYVVTGGVSGIGQLVSQMLVARGAKYLLLLPRSAGKKTSDEDFIQELKETGCHAIVRPCDISSKDALKAATSTLREHSMPPVRGVIQGATVQEDCVFERMTYQNWRAAVCLKVNGTMNLAEEFEELDFFIMLSSLAGISGNPSQANYAAGCAFQDAFARWRASQDLPAVSLNLSFVGSAGDVADKGGMAKRSTHIGYRQLSEQHVLNLVESVIRNPRRSIDTSQVVSGIATFNETQKDVPWLQEPRFAALRTLATSDNHGGRQLHGPNSKGSASSRHSIQDLLSKSDSWADGVDIVIAAITSKLSEMFMVPETDIDRSKPPSVYGVDSLLAVDLRNWLFAHLQAELSMFDVLQSESLTKLGELTAEKSKLVKQAGLAAGG